MKILALLSALVVVIALSVVCCEAEAQCSGGSCRIGKGRTPIRTLIRTVRGR